MSGGLTFLAILLPAAGFFLWLAGHFVRARRAERESILRKGVEVQAEVLSCARGRVAYRFQVSGWPLPVTGRGRVRGSVLPEPGDRIAVRYLAGHPHISAIVDGARDDRPAG